MFKSYLLFEKYECTLWSPELFAMKNKTGCICYCEIGELKIQITAHSLYHAF